jgi:hypothetical protein
MNSTIIKRKQSAIATIHIVDTHGIAQLSRRKYALTMNTQNGNGKTMSIKATEPITEPTVANIKNVISAKVKINIIPDWRCAIAN